MVRLNHRKTARSGPGPRLFVSPAGLPFRTEPDGGDSGPPPERWFTEADADKDGKLSRDEFRADFKTAFAVFDTNKDGIIDHLEVANYEEQIFPEMRTASAGEGRRGGAGRQQGGGGGRGRGGGGGGGPDGGGQRGGGGESASSGSSSNGPAYDMSRIGAARFGFLPIPHPLLDADPEMRRKITLDDYLAKADERFAMLDDMKAGALSRDALMAKLPKRPERGGKGQGRGNRGNEQTISGLVPHWGNFPVTSRSGRSADSSPA